MNSEYLIENLNSSFQVFRGESNGKIFEVLFLREKLSKREYLIVN
jgi:hypothetical protein